MVTRSSLCTVLTRGGLAAALALAGCSGGAESSRGRGTEAGGSLSADPGLRDGGKGKAKRDKAPRWVTFTPTRPPAPAYTEGDGADLPGSPIAAVALEVVSGYYARTGRAPLRYDARLEAAAGDYARAFPETGSPPRSLIDFVLRHHGIAEPFPHIAAYHLADADPDAFRADLSKDIADLIAERDNRRLGVGVTELGEGDGFRVVLAFLPGVLRLEAVPRRAGKIGTLRVRGALVSDALVAPRLVVTRSDGTVQILEPSAKKKGGARFEGEVSFDTGPGRYDVEVVADGPHGPSVVGLLPVFAGTDPPTSVRISGRGDVEGTEEDVAREVFDLVNEDRVRAGLDPVTWSDRAAAVGRAHSLDMIEAGFIGHNSPTSGTPDDRAAAGGLPMTLIEENLAKAYSAFDAHDGLMASPGHRSVVLSRGATHVGIGVVARHRPKEPTSYYVTEVFYRDAEPLDATKASDRILTLVNDARSKAGLKKLTSDALLTEMASDACRDHMTGGKPAGATTAALGKEFDRARADYASIATLMTVLPYLEAVAETPEILDKRYGAMGAGAFEGTHPTDGSGICTIVLLAVPRKK